MPERRKHPRKKVYFRVDFVDGQGHASMGLAKNLSLGGMFVELSSNLPIGEVVTTAFTLPTGQPFKAKAQVVRVDTAGFGLQFMDLQERYPTEDLEELKTYCVA